MRMFAFLLLAACAAVASAEDYAGLIFTDQSGASTTVSVDGLRMSFVGDKAVIVSNAGAVELPLSSLASMQFTTTLGATAAVADASAAVEVFTTAGVSVGRYASACDAADALPAGFYIVKSPCGVSKILVR